MPVLLLDTDILVDVLRGDADAILFLQTKSQQFQLATSVVTQMELIVGCRNKTELQALTSFLQRFQLLKITESISDRATDLLRQFRLSHGLLIPDAVIAATALEYNVSFVSKNQRDYRFIVSLNLLPYP
jgi:predicted nucleic acid-binding protein